VRLDKGLKRNINTVLVLAFIAGLLFLFAKPDYRQGEPSLRGTAEKDFALVIEGKADAPFRPEGQSRAAEFLGDVVPAVRG
jgi:hypothetical protein